MHEEMEGGSLTLEAMLSEKLKLRYSSSGRIFFR